MRELVCAQACRIIAAAVAALSHYDPLRGPLAPDGLPAPLRQPLCTFYL